MPRPIRREPARTNRPSRIARWSSATLFTFLGTATIALGNAAVAGAATAPVEVVAWVASSHGPAIPTTGRLPESYDPLNLEQLRRPTAHAPLVKYDYRYPLFDNVGSIGDCTIVAAAAVSITAHLTGQLPKLPHFSAAGAVATWRTLNGDTTLGLTDAQVLSAWTSPEGIMGTRITGWTRLDLDDVSMLQHALLRGAIFTDVSIPASYAADTPLVWNASTTTSGAWINHAIVLVGWIGPKRAFVGVTWGRTIVLPYAWLALNGEAAYAVALVGTH